MTNNLPRGTSRTALYARKKKAELDVKLKEFKVYIAKVLQISKDSLLVERLGKMMVSTDTKEQAKALEITMKIVNRELDKGVAVPDALDSDVLGMLKKVDRARRKEVESELTH